MEEPEDEEENEDDEVPLAKAAAAPSDEDLRKETLAILETVQLEDFTMKDLLRRLCVFPLLGDLARVMVQGVYIRVECWKWSSWTVVCGRALHHEGPALPLMYVSPSLVL